MDFAAKHGAVLPHDVARLLYCEWIQPKILSGEICNQLFFIFCFGRPVHENIVVSQRPLKSFPIGGALGSIVLSSSAREC